VSATSDGEYLESQTQFGDIPGPRKGSAGTFLDPTQPVADRVRVAHKHLTRTARRRIIVMPTKTEYAEGTPNWVDVQTTDQ
jgi:hypothetical protein